MPGVDLRYVPPTLIRPTPGGAAGDGSIAGSLALDANKTVLDPNDTPILTAYAGAIKRTLLVVNGGGTQVGSYFDNCTASAIFIGAGSGFAVGNSPAIPNRWNGVYTKGLGAAPIYGLDNRSGVTVPDAAPIVLYTTTAAGQAYRVTVRLNATAHTSGTAIYTLSWTEGGAVLSAAVSATAANQAVSESVLIQPDSGTAVNVQITGAFVATLNVAASAEELA